MEAMDIPGAKTWLGSLDRRLMLGSCDIGEPVAIVRKRPRRAGGSQSVYL